MRHRRRLPIRPLRIIGWLEDIATLSAAYQAGESHITQKCRVPEGWVL